jgi:hypothetical protein
MKGAYIVVASIAGFAFCGAFISVGLPREGGTAQAPAIPKHTDGTADDPLFAPPRVQDALLATYGNWSN